MNHVYQIENVTKRFGKGRAAQKSRPANSDISLEIQAGEVFGLLGSNGAGKSTLIRQMVNLLAPTEGRIWLYGNDIAHKPEAVTRYVAYMPQKPIALLDLTTEEAIYFTGHMRGMERAEAKRQADQLVTTWGLDEVRHKAVRHLSGGQHRLVGLAVTLIGARPVLILDEPTNELDPAYRKLVWEYIRELNQQHGTTIILVTHNVQEAERALDRVAIMSQGKVVGRGRVSELKAQIDQSIRLELFLKPETAAQSALLLRQFERAQELKALHWAVLVPRTNAEDTIHTILSSVRLENLEDFRVHTATLEDVYMNLTGRTIEEAEQ